MDTTLFHQSRHLDEDALCAPAAGCPFCGGESRDPVWTLQTSPDVYLLRCRQCDAVSASRMPTAAALDAYYGSYYSASGTDAEAHVTIDEPGRLAARLADAIASGSAAAPVRILDFGGGDGTISRLLAERLVAAGRERASVVVVDYDDRVVASRDERVDMQRQAALDDSAGHFDMVLASAVIEHYADPADLLGRLLSRVKPNGMFYARTPSMVPLMRLLKPFGVALDFTYPGHLHDLGQRFWEGYFRSGAPGFTLRSSRPSIVETTLSRHFLRTVAAHALKLPWHVLGRRYTLVGGWEILAQRTT